MISISSPLVLVWRGSCDGVRVRHRLDAQDGRAGDRGAAEGARGRARACRTRRNAQVSDAEGDAHRDRHRAPRPSPRAWAATACSLSAVATKYVFTLESNEWELTRETPRFRSPDKLVLGPSRCRFLFRPAWPAAAAKNKRNHQLLCAICSIRRILHKLYAVFLSINSPSVCIFRCVL